MTITDLIKATYRLMHVIAKSEVPDNDEMQDAMQAANIMIDAWGAEGLMMVGNALENFPILQAVQSYSIGIGQTFNTSKPYDIKDAFIRDQNNLDYPLNIIGENQWDALLDKSVTVSMPEALFYDRGQTQQATQTGTINIYYMPDKNYTLFINSQKGLTDFSMITDNFTFEPPYERCFKFNLAIELWYEYYPLTTSIPIEIKNSAEESKRIVKRLNKQQYVATTDVPGRKGIYSIYADRTTN
jgi:hypothetical protein